MSWKQFFKTFSRTVIIILLLLAALLVLLSVTGVINPDIYLRRMSAAHSAQDGDGSFAVTVTEDTASGRMDSSLLLVSKSGATLYSSGGAVIDGISMMFSEPRVHCSGKYGVAYDAGGNNVALFSDAGCVYELESENTVISATVGADGRLALCTKEDRYLGAVTVYSREGAPIYKIYSAEGYPLAAQVLPDGADRLAVLRLNSDGSCVDIYDMHATQAYASFVLDDAVIADIACLSENRILLLGTQGIYIIDAEAKQVGVLELGDAGLCAWSYSEGFISIATSSGGLSPVQTLMTLDTDGQIIAAADFGNGVDSLSQSGSYLAVVAGGDLTIYNSQLKKCDSFSLDGADGRAWMRADGTAAVIGNNTVLIFG